MFWKEKRLLILLALSALLAVGYGLSTTVGGAPDESAHARYVYVLATDHRLPVLDLAHRKANPDGDVDFESHQPPLYYTAAVPFYLVGRAVGGEVGGAWGCRVLSMLIGLAGTVLVWLLARELAPGRAVVHLTAAGFAALLPMRLSVMSSVGNDGLTEALSTLALLLMARMLVAETPTAKPDARRWSRSAAQLGVVVGLALLTKATSILLLPPLGLTLYLASGARDQRRDSGEWTGRFVKAAGVAGAAVAVLAGWWFLRNNLLYGDPLGKRMFDEYFADTNRWTRDGVLFPRLGGDTLPIGFSDYMFRLVLPTSFASFWGAFGHLMGGKFFMGVYNPDAVPTGLDPLVKGLQGLWPILWVNGKPFIPYTSWVYPLLEIVVLISIAGWVRRKLRKPSGSPASAVVSARWVVGIHAIFVFAALLNFNATYFQGQGRYLLPALGFLSLALTGGWLAWSPRRERVTAGVVLSGMLALAVYALFGVLGPAFASG